MTSKRLKLFTLTLALTSCVAFNTILANDNQLQPPISLTHLIPAEVLISSYIQNSLPEVFLATGQRLVIYQNRDSKSSDQTNFVYFPTFTIVPDPLALEFPFPLAEEIRLPKQEDAWRIRLTVNRNSHLLSKLLASYLCQSNITNCSALMPFSRINISSSSSWCEYFPDQSSDGAAGEFNILSCDLKKEQADEVLKMLHTKEYIASLNFTITFTTTAMSKSKESGIYGYQQQLTTAFAKNVAESSKLSPKSLPDGRMLILGVDANKSALLNIAEQTSRSLVIRSVGETQKDIDKWRPVLERYLTNYLEKIVRPGDSDFAYAMELFKKNVDLHLKDITSDELHSYLEKIATNSASANASASSFSGKLDPKSGAPEIGFSNSDANTASSQFAFETKLNGNIKIPPGIKVYCIDQTALNSRSLISVSESIEKPVGLVTSSELNCSRPASYTPQLFEVHQKLNLGEVSINPVQPVYSENVAKKMKEHWPEAKFFQQGSAKLHFLPKTSEIKLSGFIGVKHWEPQNRDTTAFAHFEVIRARIPVERPAVLAAVKWPDGEEVWSIDKDYCLEMKPFLGGGSLLHHDEGLWTFAHGFPASESSSAKGALVESWSFSTVSPNVTGTLNLGPLNLTLSFVSYPWVKLQSSN